MLDVSTYNQRVLVSSRFIDKIALVCRQQRKTLKQIATEYGWNPTAFSAIINHHFAIAKNDSRIVRLIEDIGLQVDECFE